MTETERAIEQAQIRLNRTHQDLQSKVKPWSYNTWDVVTRLPFLVGHVWEQGYGVKLVDMSCVPASSFFDGAHMGKGHGPEVWLAKDGNGGMLLIQEKPF